MGATALLGNLSIPFNLTPNDISRELGSRAPGCLPKDTKSTWVCVWGHAG